MTHLHFDDQEFVGADEEFSLEHATFSGCTFRTCSFRSSKITDAEFVGCDLREVVLAGNDFAATVFQGNDLREADMRGSRGYVISALNNQLRGLRVELPEALGLLAALEVKVEG